MGLGHQSDLHAVSPHGEVGLISQHASHIGPNGKPHPLSAIGLVHQDGEYSTLSAPNQGQNFGGPNQKPIENVIFAMEGLSPLNIKMGSLAGSFGTLTPEGASLASSAQVAQPNAPGG